jgi:DNA-binding SARP family transcriptional activator
MKAPGLIIRVLGPASVARGGAPVQLPSSRKVRALLAYLALAAAPISRPRLCSLLWDVPNDPRGELRWCLSKLRSFLDDEGRRRVVTSGENLVAVDLSDCAVDVVEIERLLKAGVSGVAQEKLAEACALFGGDLLDGLQIDGNPEFTGWLSAQRHRFRAMQVAVLGELAARCPCGSDEMFRRLEQWLQLAPFDPRAHEVMLDALVKRGRIQDAENHVDATIRAFEQEGVDWSALRDAWQARRRAVSAPASAAAPERPADARPKRHASVAVMPFVDRANGMSRIADGLTEDIITRLAKLRALFVIARGTVFTLRDRGVGAQEAGRLLDVAYVVSGSLRDEGGRVTVLVELVDTENARIVWTDELDGTAGEAITAVDAIVDRIVASVAEEIEAAECKRAMLKPPSSLDSWEAYHRGLWHMYKFTGQDNRQASQFFQDALKLDPTFARAYAGLSFTHFQNAFLDLTPDRDRQITLAFESAAQSVEADVRDPAAHWAMGRALWLRGAQKDSLSELTHSIQLSPNFALGHYTIGFVESQGGDPRAAIQATTTARQLSPFDPLQFAMLASRALAHVRLGELDEAAEWATKATGRPNAHVHILAIAAVCLALNERRDEARTFAGRIRERASRYSVEDFLRAFRFDADATRMLRRAAKQIGFDARR